MSTNQRPNKNEIADLINSAFERDGLDIIFQLRERYSEKIKDLDIKSFQIEKNLGIDYKQLNSLLDGEIKKADFIPLLKLGYFLGISEKDISTGFTKLMAREYASELEDAKKKTFILDYFDLPTLKEIGIIDTTKDFEHIESRINKIFGISSILDYDTGESGAAFSNTVLTSKINKSSKSKRNRKYFIDKSKAVLKAINNPHKYNKEALVEYFPKIRWHSTNIEHGLVNVIKSLFKLGVTIIFQPKVPSLKMRGATFEVNDKPCIVITDYRNSYPTMWFALLHELFHVLFDWDDILVKKYHLSIEDDDLDILPHGEAEANEFAMDYLFPKSKVDFISDKINNNYFIKEFAIDHHVHASIIYAYYAHLYSTDDNNCWMKYQKQMSPPIANLISKLDGGLKHISTAMEFANYYLTKIYDFDEKGGR